MVSDYSTHTRKRSLSLVTSDFSDLYKITSKLCVLL